VIIPDLIVLTVVPDVDVAEFKSAAADAKRKNYFMKIIQIKNLFVSMQVVL
jgi:hypothetical protein